MAANEIGYALNYANKLELDITPDADEPTWALIAKGVSSIEPAGNEEVSQDPDYSGKGMAESDVTGGQITLAVSGYRYYGDPAQDFVASRAYSYGEARKTRFRWTQPNGDKLQGKCTLANISPGSELGDANAKGTFNYEVHLNGLPRFTSGDTKMSPASIAAGAEEVSVAVEGTTKVTASVSPEGASQDLLFEIDDERVATVDAEGNVTGVKVGTTELVIYSYVKPSVHAVVPVEVTAKTE